MSIQDDSKTLCPIHPWIYLTFLTPIPFTAPRRKLDAIRPEHPQNWFTSVRCVRTTVGFISGGVIASEIKGQLKVSGIWPATESTGKQRYRSGAPDVVSGRAAGEITARGRWRTKYELTGAVRSFPSAKTFAAVLETRGTPFGTSARSELWWRLYNLNGFVKIIGIKYNSLKYSRGSSRVQIM